MLLCEMHVVGCQLKEKHTKSDFLGIEVYLKVFFFLLCKYSISPLLHISDSKIVA